MKMNFMSKKVADYTGSDLIKWICVIYAIIIAIYGAIYVAVFKGEAIHDWCKQKIKFVKEKLTNRF